MAASNLHAAADGGSLLAARCSGSRLVRRRYAYAGSKTQSRSTSSGIQAIDQIIEKTNRSIDYRRRPGLLSPREAVRGGGATSHSITRPWRGKSRCLREEMRVT